MVTISENYGGALDLNLLRVFAVVAEERSLTRAAARLYVTQPAVSAALRRLTSFLGAELFVRHGRGVTLTARGNELLRAARNHLQPLVAATLASPIFDATTSRATVRVGVFDGTEMAIVPKLVARMRAQAPQMQLIVLPVQFRTIEELLLSNKVDLALCVADELPRSILRELLIDGRAVRDSFTCLYDPRFSKLPAKLTEREYFAREHVAVSYAGDVRGIVEDSLGRARTVRISVPSLGLVADLVDGSDLLATVPKLLAEHIVKTRPHLRSVGLPFAIEGASLELFWTRAADDEPVVGFMRALVAVVVRELAAVRPASRARRARSRTRR